MEYRDILSGIFPSITTPFTDGHVNYDLLRSNVQKYNEYEFGGYMILGGNGEYLGLTPDETLKAAETIVSAKKAGRSIVVGAGRESAHSTVDFIKSIAGIGVDIASIITPFYYAKYITDENLVAYYSKIADESPIPVMIYNSPSYAAGIAVSDRVISELSGHENIAGMKNSSSREISEYARAAGENKRFVFHAGRVSDLLRDFKQGVIGATLSMADYWPEDCIRLYTHLNQGMDDDAAELCMRIDSAGKAGASAYGVAGVKYAMDIAGFYGGEPRLPLQPLNEKQKKMIKESFRLKEKSARYEDIDRV